MKEIKFVIRGEPPRATAQEQKTTVRNGYIMKYDPPNVKQAKQYLYYGVIPYRPAEPIEGAITLNVEWRFTAKRKKDIGKPKTTRPDTDNLDKGLKDIMTKAGFWHDDAQVTEEHIRKIWSDHAGIEITVTSNDTDHIFE